MTRWNRNHAAWPIGSSYIASPPSHRINTHQKRTDSYRDLPSGKYPRRALSNPKIIRRPARLSENHTDGARVMSYTNSRESQENLRRVIKNDLDAPPGQRRSAAAIVRALNAFLTRTARDERVIVNTENVEHYIRTFASGGTWRDDVTKQLLWEMYVEERGLTVIAPGEVTIEAASRVLEQYYQRRASNLEPLTGLVGKFLIYKRAIMNPNGLVVRGLIELRAVSEGSLEAEEIHINRSHTDKVNGTDLEAEPPRETWLGTLLPRERSYCLISKEMKYGTPKFAVLESAHIEDGRINTLHGYSIECIERWGGGRVLRSGIFMERVGHDFTCDSPLVDLVSFDDLRNSKRYVIDYLIRLGGPHESVE
jgi:hypothetical protein